MKDKLMSKTFNYRTFTKLLKQHGCKMVRQGEGSHVIWHSPITKQNFTVANHKGKEFKKGTVRKMKNEAGIK